MSSSSPHAPTKRSGPIVTTDSSKTSSHLQSELAAQVAHAIAVQLTPTEATRLARRHVVNPDAQLEYFKGRHSAWGRSPDGVELGLRHVQRALDIDPEFATASSALADCHMIRATRGMAPPAEAAREATAAARHALELDPSLADAHVSIGVVQMHAGDLHEAIRSLRHAIELNPALAIAHNMLARVLSAFERHEEALAAAQRSVSLDPLAVMLHTILADVYYFARQYEKAVLSYRMAIELDPRFASAHTDLARALEALGPSTRRARHTKRDGGCRAACRPVVGCDHGRQLKRGGARMRLRRRECSVSYRPGESAPCTRALVASTRRIAGWSWPCRRRRRDSSSCACILDWIRFDPTRATGRSSGAWVSTMPRSRIAS